MRAVSLLQPWATLIALGYKQYETRSWSTKYRGPLAIHASAGKSAAVRELCATDPIISAILKKHGLTYDALPRGVVLGITTIDEVWEVEKLLRIRRLNDTELACGDYSPNRYIWELGNFRKPDELPKCKGMLSLWEVPESVDFQLRCPECFERLNPDALCPCLCGGEPRPAEPDGEPTYTSDGYPY
jgi:hypothetical protein